MTARILVVDDISTNVKLLQARLNAEYFDVVTADDGYKALEICEREQVDLILLDIMMPGIDGFEVCERLKSNPATSFIPVVIVTALDQPSDRVRGLKAGADDFLTKPVNDLQLVSRVKSLIRLKMLSDELRLRAQSAFNMGGMDELLDESSSSVKQAKILLLDSRPNSQERIVRALKPIGDIDILTDANAAVFKAADNDYELAIINTNLEGCDPLRLCSQLRSVERTRFLPILIVTEQGDEFTVSRAMDIGVNDYIIRPIDPNEMVARALTQIKRKRFNDKLRESLKLTMEMAVIDGLTGLNNRRFLDNHLKTLFDRSVMRNNELSICIADIDHFKSINDTYGHDVGDEVLREFASRLRTTVRGADLACRYGGEEFVVVMPDTAAEDAACVAERLRAVIEGQPFEIKSLDVSICVTTSVGVASRGADTQDVLQLMKNADNALYAAKAEGRNRIVCAA